MIFFYGCVPPHRSGSGHTWHRAWLKSFRTHSILYRNKYAGKKEKSITRTTTKQHQQGVLNQLHLPKTQLGFRDLKSSRFFFFLFFTKNSKSNWKNAKIQHRKSFSEPFLHNKIVKNKKIKKKPLIWYYIYIATDEWNLTVSRNELRPSIARICTNEWTLIARRGWTYALFPNWMSIIRPRQQNNNPMLAWRFWLRIHINRSLRVPWGTVLLWNRGIVSDIRIFSKSIKKCINLLFLKWGHI